MVSDEDARSAARRIVEQVLAADEASTHERRDPVPAPSRGTGARVKGAGARVAGVVAGAAPPSEARVRARALVAEVVAEAEQRAQQERQAAQEAARAAAAAAAERERAREAARRIEAAREAEAARAAAERARREEAERARREEAERARRDEAERAREDAERARQEAERARVAEAERAREDAERARQEAAERRAPEPRAATEPLSVAELAAEGAASDLEPTLALHRAEADRTGGHDVAVAPRPADGHDVPALEAVVEPPLAPAEPPPRTGRWLVASIAGAIALAIIFPLAVRALLQLVALS